VADLNDFAGLPLHVNAEPGIFKNVRPHVTRTVNWTAGGATFPLLPRYLEHNETLKGIEECEIHMRYERAKRKGEDEPKFTVDEAKAFRSFAQFKLLKSVAVEEGREIEPDELAKVELPEIFPIDPDDVRDVSNKELPFEK
jgi:hypothetical protein